MKSTTHDPETPVRRASQRRVASALRQPAELRNCAALSSRSSCSSLSSSRAALSGLAALSLSLVAAPARAADALVLVPDWPILGGLIVGFVVLMFPANQLIFKPIFRALDEREERIDGARSRASHIQRDADQVLADYEARIREARADAEAGRKGQIAAARQEQAAMTSAARAEAETRIEEARATLAGDLEGAREQMRTSAQELARAAAEQILGRSLS